MSSQLRHVLVVDDDLALRELITVVLEFGSSVVTSVASGHAALAYLQTGAQEPDLIVLDLDLGDMTGEAVVMALCQRDSWSTIPVVLLSGSPRVAQAAQLLGVAAYVQKPFDPTALQAVVQQHARSVRPLKRAV